MYALAALLSYLFGSIPTAYIVVKWRTGKTIWEHGSGNVGTLNTYRVTHSPAIAALVLLIDITKAILAYFVVKLLCPSALAVVPFFVVLGHNYPVWTRFKGGRGLAVFLILALIYQWPFVAFWAVVWTATYLLSGYLAVATVVSTVVVPFVMTAFGVRPYWAIILAEIPLLLRYREKMVALANGRLKKHYWGGVS